MMRCKECNCDCYGLVDIDKQLCMPCWDKLSQKPKGMNKK